MINETETTVPCPKEAKQQKKCSPGIVENKESIVFVVIDPLHCQDGKLISAAFPTKRLTEGTLSVSRGDHSTLADVLLHVVDPQLSRDSKRKLMGACRTRCAEIRAIKGSTDKARLFCVIDDGSNNYPAHAHIGYSDSTKEDGFWSRNERTAARANLTRVFEQGGILPLDTCFIA